MEHLEFSILSKLAKELPLNLSNRYHISQQYVSGSFEGYKLNTIPDLLIYDTGNRKLYILEIKGSHPDDDLPYGILSGLKNIKEINKQHELTIILISISNVPEELKILLEEENIKLIEWTKDKEMIQKIKEFVK